MNYEYNAYPIFKTKLIHILICRVWYFGYQIYPDGRGYMDIDILLVPPLMLKIKKKI